MRQVTTGPASNPIGGIVGKIKATPDVVEPGSLAPYSEVFGLQRFRECELIHGRWAMLAVLGVLVGEAVTGVAWQDAGLYEATNGATYWGNPLPFTGTQITWFEVGYHRLFSKNACLPSGFDGGIC